MPTDKELIDFVDFSFENKITLAFAEVKSGKMTPSVLEKMKLYVPAMTDVYGLTEGFDPHTQINFIVIHPHQMRMFLEQVRKIHKEISNMLSQYSYSHLFIGVEKKEGDALSSVTDPKKIVIGLC